MDFSCSADNCSRMCQRKTTQQSDRFNHMQQRKIGCGFLTPSIFPNIPPCPNFLYSVPVIPNTAWLYPPRICNACNLYMKSLNWETSEQVNVPKEVHVIFSNRGLTLFSNGNNWLGCSLPGNSDESLTCQVPLDKIKPWQKRETMPNAE